MDLGTLTLAVKKVFNTDNDVCFIGFDGNLTFNTAEFAFDNFYFMPNSKISLLRLTPSGFRSITNIKSSICLSGYH